MLHHLSPLFSIYSLPTDVKRWKTQNPPTGGPKTNKIEKLDDSYGGFIFTRTL